MTIHTLPAGCRSHVVGVGGNRVHCVEAGAGPLVLLVHGFPESWYSWRHQLPALADAGFRVVAIDVRGYGRSSKPLAVEDYRMVRLVADNVGLVSALGAETATVIGHDWGAPIAWNSAMLRPDVFTAVAGLSVPFAPPSEVRPSIAMRAMAGDEEFYVEYFQEPGRAGPRPRSRPTCATGCSGSCSADRATPRRPIRRRARSRPSLVAPA